MHEAEKRRVKMIEKVEGDIYLLYMKKVLLLYLQDLGNNNIIKKLSCSFIIQQNTLIILL